MSVPLRVLIIEASQTDFLSIVVELRSGGYDPQCCRVDNSAQLHEALREKWDAILCDYILPEFSAAEALHILHEEGLDIPFIVVAGTSSEHHIQDALKAGASDYICKGELARLNVAVKRELRAAEGRRERRRLEEQLRHAQKMEAVGRLAGGVAHDFNNLLTIISGYSELLLAGDDLNRTHRAALDEIRRAAQRGGALTHQLLAFSRRQPLVARIVHLNELLMAMERMLRRLIGEDIEMITLPAAAQDTVKTDPGQLEQVIMNIVVNARDAMPNGGKLTVEAGNVYLDEGAAAQFVDLQPGPYVVLTVTDTGTGMDARTRERLFEPFFTTKAPGRGTGLGLATAYGIVKQSGGSISVASEPGGGTALTIHLPLSVEVTEPAPSQEPAAPKLTGCETILLVEDEPRVRRLICDLLMARGYHVLSASRGEEALRLLDAYRGPVHLAVLDVVMPELSGPEVGKRIAARRPETRLLYMSGYTDEAIIHHGVLESGIPFLQKPFLPQALARKIREVLDSHQISPAANIQ